jgi:hypothetical protein
VVGSFAVYGAGGGRLRLTRVLSDATFDDVGRRASERAVHLLPGFHDNGPDNHLDLRGDLDVSGDLELHREAAFDDARPRLGFWRLGASRV